MYVSAVLTAPFVLVLAVFALEAINPKAHWTNTSPKNNFKSRNSVPYHRFVEFGTRPLLTSYDFIIVGAGSSGGVLASRLSENPNFSVLLIEAGGRELFSNDIPLGVAFVAGTGFNWGYTAEPQNSACLGMVDRRCNLPKGKGVGGSTLINYMVYHRGNRFDFDSWAAKGNPGWSYHDVLPYFIKSEYAQLEGLENSTYHGRRGPFSNEYPRYRTPYAEAFLEGNEYLGYPVTDYNGANQVGVSLLQTSTRQGTRENVGTAYINPAYANRGNFHIMTETFVTQVLIDPKTKTAYGVEFSQFKHTGRVFARKEVILSAGGFNSAHLLMLSGVGPRTELKRVGIPLIHDLPVGRRFYDHVAHFGPTWRVNTTSGFSVTLPRAFNLPSLTNYYINGRGMLTLPGGIEALAMIKTPGSDFPPSVPDAEMIFVAGSLASDQGTGIRSSMSITDEIYEAVFRELDREDIDTFSVMVTAFHPKSVGYIDLKDKNPFHRPRIYLNFLQHPDDVEIMLEGIKHAVRVMKTAPFKKFGITLHDTPLPNCKHLIFGTDDYWRCSIRTLSTSFHHQVGACKMGPATNPTSVVSNELKVHGIKGLRVVDTSIVPLPPTCHTGAIGLMIGEKAADMIKYEWA